MLPSIPLSVLLGLFVAILILRSAAERFHR